MYLLQDYLTFVVAPALDGVLDEAKDAIDTLLPFADAVDKMAALSLKGSILASSRQIQEALATIVGALSDLGETIPQTYDDETLESLFAQTLQSVVRESSQNVGSLNLLRRTIQRFPLLIFTIWRSG